MSRNDYKKVETTNAFRSINRRNWDSNELLSLLKKDSINKKVYLSILKLIKIRKKQKAFHPNATQFTLQLHKNLFGIWRQSIDKSQNIFAITNISSVTTDLKLSKINLFENQLWFDLFEPNVILNDLKVLKLNPFQTVWISNKIN